MKVNREDPPDKKKTKKICIEISWHVLGKIGTELLIESYGSFFSTYAVGIVCLKSEVNCSFLRHYIVKLHYLELDKTV